MGEFEFEKCQAPGEMIRWTVEGKVILKSMKNNAIASINILRRLTRNQNTTTFIILNRLNVCANIVGGICKIYY